MKGLDQGASMMSPQGIPVTLEEERGENGIIFERKRDAAGNVWTKHFERDSQGNVIEEKGKITEGPEKGREWLTKFSQSQKADGTVEYKEEGVILVQGEDESKESAGHSWTESH